MITRILDEYQLIIYQYQRIDDENLINIDYGRRLEWMA
jgi:hypothetical protein